MFYQNPNALIPQPKNTSTVRSKTNNTIAPKATTTNIASKPSDTTAPKAAPVAKPKKRLFNDRNAWFFETTKVNKVRNEIACKIFGGLQPLIEYRVTFDQRLSFLVDICGPSPPPSGFP